MTVHKSSFKRQCRALRVLKLTLRCLQRLKKVMPFSKTCTRRYPSKTGRNFTLHTKRTWMYAKWRSKCLGKHSMMMLWLLS